MVMEKGDKRHIAAATICTLCLLCLACKLKGPVMYYGVGGVQRYLQDNGVGLVDVGVAVVFYEMLGFLAMLSFWITCFMVQPLQNGFLRPLMLLLPMAREAMGSSFDKFEAAYEAVFARVQQKFQRVAGWLRVDPVRFTTSYAEGAVCRGVLKPLLVPLKLYCAYLMVLG
eukprot:CAMPEP_0196728552 /NCGR_PEP_ID=MMETSP1091-20130531/9197_1 /TAXON_ID=302021 /ORGANISM="Rhodomonas sp., Strain CCMP768" /LENGTH=169 /DNA_ID=CAMNT_0042071313 /DNA_START=212 /DNA_END=718 /DNA_ORIENTATION=-